MKESKGKEMKKDIEWLKEEIGDLPITDTVFISDGLSYIDSAVSVTSVYDLIYHLEGSEVLSQEWIRNNQERKGVHFFVNVNKLQNLLVPEQEELESKIKALIEAYKQEDGAYSNPENGWISGFVEDLENLVEEEPLYYALIKGHELVDDYDIYWNCDKSDYGVFVSRLHPPHDNFLTEMSKEDWNKLGINDSNADFVKVKE